MFVCVWLSVFTYVGLCMEDRVTGYFPQLLSGRFVMVFYITWSSLVWLGWWGQQAPDLGVSATTYLLLPVLPWVLELWSQVIMFG